MSAAAGGALSLWPARKWVDQLYTDFLGSPSQLDRYFLVPSGEQALAAATSVSWQVFRNPISLFVGGVTAVLMELGHPAVRDGVWTYSDFRRNPKGRLQRTGLAAMVTVYGARSAAAAMIEKVVAAHNAVTGTDETGRSYTANDDDLLTYVQSTASYGFAAAYSRLLVPLSALELDAFYTEAIPAAQLYGVREPIASSAAMDAYLSNKAEALTPSPVIGEFLDLIRAAPIFPKGGRALQKVLVDEAIRCVPAAMAANIALDVPPADERSQWLAKLAARTANALEVRNAPHMLAATRLGLDADLVFPKAR